MTAIKYCRPLAAFRLFLLLVGAVLWNAVFLSAVEPTVFTIQSVPSPKVHWNGFVSDPGGILGADLADKINQLLIKVEKETTAEHAVVVLGSIGTEVPKSFAVQLFEHWGIGKKGKDNGLLLLVVLDQRSYEYETGYGLEGVLPDVILSRIGRENFPVHFRAGKYGEGIFAATQEVSRLLLANKEEVALDAGQREEKVREKKDLEEKKWSEYRKERKRTKFKTVIFVTVFLFSVFGIGAVVQRRKAWKEYAEKQKQPVNFMRPLPLPPMPLLLWLPLVFIWPLAGSLAYYWFQFTGEVREVLPWADEDNLAVLGVACGYLLICVLLFQYRMRKTLQILGLSLDPQQKYARLKESMKDILFATIFAPLFFLPFLAFAFWKLKRLREHPRSCQKCQEAMVRLGESEDDPHLEKGRQLEEEIGSVDYDVWFCRNCSEVQILPYIKSSPYKACESCTFIASHTERIRTELSPTYSASGRGARDETCRHCGRKKTSTFTIPQLERSTSSGSYSSSSRSGSSSSGSRGSSSSSSGSFGGGRSGGGGAGGKW